ncbi:hypothetical protein GCM10011490_05980 [Pseudoclavibacter endophyticus]|uniref:VWA domain-containing protein n=1 Tax=Pseudoclavibacter endophyticus TaxID=1778590 RepID=A0A6H9WM32_9MICO|nr:VWA domain-containing protein [Pseudoclavibacter endophyticus]KAB1649906.1 VWA domain-containing protein [Pseudoclavibacter endophyticus]GGA58822.1 hypothetical protein GCM10011490_05980 [Pseudoclavibacter endophyticus]
MAIAFWYVTVGLLALAAAVGLAAWFLRRRKATTARIPVANSERLTRLPSYRRALMRATAMLSVAAVALAVVLVTTAVASGRWIYQQIETPEKFNRDIVLCLDISGSMIDYDVEVIDRYLEMLPGFDGERMALMLWDSTAAEVFPLTDDYAFVETQLTEVRDQMAAASGAGIGGSDTFTYGTQNAPGASLVGDGLASCVLAFDGDTEDGRSRSVIFATDNAVNGSPIISLPDAASFAQSQEVKVYGLDANTYEDAFADEYRTAVVQNGGLYYKLTDTASVKGIVDEITSDQTSLMQGAPQVLVVDRPAGWLIIMLVGFTVYLVIVWRVRL